MFGKLESIGEYESHLIHLMEMEKLEDNDDTTAAVSEPIELQVKIVALAAKPTLKCKV